MSVKSYNVLSYQHAYVVLVAFVLAVFVADTDELGSHTLVITLVLDILGAVHRLANVKLVPLGIT